MGFAQRVTSDYLRLVLKVLGLQREGLACATRHTFASQWVMAGGSIEKQKEILGHCSVVVTERYARLRPDLFPAKDLGTIALDLMQTQADVVQLGRKTGSRGPRAPSQPPR